MQPFPVIPNTELFLAGGAVRDTLLGKTPKDRDFVAVTDFTFNSFVDAVNTVGKVFQERPEFLTIRCRIDNEAIDLVFPRGEGGYEDARHPSMVRRLWTLEEDAARRDFTVNAMFMDSTGKVIDFFGGENDLQARVIRAVGDPVERFTEDALRILRMVRFACRLDFKISGATKHAARVMAPNLVNVSAERIREELSAALLANPARAMQLLIDLDVFDIIAEKGITFLSTLKER